MAFTERYVTTTGAGAHDGTSEADAWSFDEMVSPAPAAGTRVNMKAGSYSIGTTTLPNNGTASAPIVLRVYNSTPGDLDAQGRNADGTLNTTNFGTITVTGILSPGTFLFLQNWNVTGALSSHLIGTVSVDQFVLISCAITNTQNNAAARCLVGDNGVDLINCDFYCSGAAHASVVDLDLSARVNGCRFRGTSTSALLTVDSIAIKNSAFWGNASAVGIVIGSSPNNASQMNQIVNNTFYGIGTAITFPDVTPTSMAVLINNHCTDCAKWLDNLHSATAAIAVIEANNRLRDVTTPRTGIESITLGEVTTDTGGAETDYEDAGNGNFYLISGAPGRGIGMPPHVDAGAYHHADPAGGGGGGGRIVNGGVAH